MLVWPKVLSVKLCRWDRTRCTAFRCAGGDVSGRTAADHGGSLQGVCVGMCCEGHLSRCLPAHYFKCVHVFCHEQHACCLLQADEGAMYRWVLREQNRLCPGACWLAREALQTGHAATR